MTRRGKIARLPRIIRDELNQRLDNGERGARLLEWLNNLPEVKQVIEREFAGRPINKVNLSDWKKGGFADWQSRQEVHAMVENLCANAKEYGEVSPDELIESLTTVLTAHFAVAFQRTTWDDSEESRTHLRRVRKPLRDVIRLRHSETARQQVEIQQERLELQAEISAQRLDLERQKLELARQKLEYRQRMDLPQPAHAPEVLEKPALAAGADQKANVIQDVPFLNHNVLEPSACSGGLPVCHRAAASRPAEHPSFCLPATQEFNALSFLVRPLLNELDPGLVKVG